MGKFVTFSIRSQLYAFPLLKGEMMFQNYPSDEEIGKLSGNAPSYFLGILNDKDVSHIPLIYLRSLLGHKTYEEAVKEVQTEIDKVIVKINKVLETKSIPDGLTNLVSNLSGKYDDSHFTLRNNFNPILNAYQLFANAISTHSSTDNEYVQLIEALSTAKIGFNRSKIEHILKVCIESGNVAFGVDSPSIVEDVPEEEFLSLNSMFRNSMLSYFYKNSQGHTVKVLDLEKIMKKIFQDVANLN